MTIPGTETEPTHVIEFTVHGRPQGKQQVRVTGRGAFTPAKTRNYMSLIQDAWRKVEPEGWQPWAGYVHLKVDAVFSIPESWPAWRKADEEEYTSAPDWDNVGKVVGDALKGAGAFGNDARITKGEVTKTFCRTGIERLAIYIAFLPDAAMRRAAQKKEIASHGQDHG